MKYCTKCGCELDNDASVCKECGNPVEQVHTQFIQKQQTNTNVIGIIAFILSILGFLTGFIGIGIILDVIAIILAIVSLVQANKRSLKKGLSIAAIVIAAVSMIFISLLYVNNLTKNYFAVRDVQNTINNIGEVSVESREIINKAEDKYNELSEEDKNKVNNYEILVEAKKQYVSKLSETAMPLKDIITDIARDYLNNPARAMEQYNNKIVSFSGVITEINGSGRITASGLSSYAVYNITKTIPVMSISMPHDNVALFNKGDSINVVGSLELPSGGGNLLYININDAYSIKK